jgi:hypothetical protein
MSLTQYSYGSGNWSEFVSRCEKTGKGLIALSLTNYDNNNACEIAEGSVVEINGAIFRQESGNTSITGTPANNAINYILMSAANNTATAAWNNSTPSWNTAYQGFYVGGNRYVGECYYDGSNYYGKCIYNSADPRQVQMQIPLLGYVSSGNAANIFPGGMYIRWIDPGAAGTVRIPLPMLYDRDVILRLKTY